MVKKKSAGKPKIKAKQPQKPRVRALPTHRSFRLSKTRLKQPKALPSAWQLTKKTGSILWSNKRLYLGIILIQVVISVVLVQGIGSSFDISDLKYQIEEALGENNNSIGTGIALLSYLASSVNSQASDLASAYQLFLTLVTVLATIWCTRQILADEKPSIRDGFYKGMYPLIPFVFVLMVIGLQLIPVAVGNFLYSTVIAQGLAVTSVEKIVWLLLFLAFMMLSLYMVASSLFALFIVTLPDMTPVRALRSARQLVLHRRLGVMLRLVAFPIMVVALVIVVFLPLVIFVTALAQPLFIVSSGLGLVSIIIYTYNLYRALL